MQIAVLSGFLLATLILFAGKFFTGKRSILLALLPLGLFTYFLSFIPQVRDQGNVVFSYRWIPALGIQLDYLLDGLSLLFCLLITGIGTLIFLYASAYMKGMRRIHRFYGFLLVFMASMLGLVLCDNVLALFVFWELTSISSFFLIGYDSESGSSRKAALLSLTITGGGGFLLLAGFVMMGNITGSYSITDMAENMNLLHNSNLYWLMLLLVLGGAFTKSAQFPFHFWLPGAMQAPTPVSAYLHSATMVKAGVYLIARLTPVLGNHIFWNNVLMIVGGVTMVYAAFQSLFRKDLKGILAYSTISALGVLVFQLGIGTQQALLAAAVFILVHALYKAGLFLVTGIIDHETGTRDVTILSGLKKVMMPVAVAGFLAAISNAGIPFTFGFLGKDLLYEGTLSAGTMVFGLTAAAVVTNIMLLYAGFVAGIKPFTGPLLHVLEDVHMPPMTMWLPPLILGICSLVFGMFPAIIDTSLVQPVVLAMDGAATYVPLKLWHGFNLVLLLSVITLAVGYLFYHYSKPSKEKVQFINRFQPFAPQKWIEGIADTVMTFARYYSLMMQNGNLRSYVLIIVVFITALLSYRLFTGVNIYINQDKLHEITVYEIVVTCIIIISIIKIVFTDSRLVSVAAMGVVGYCICLLFMFYSAPDLAMTQFTIDTLTVVLFVLVLFRLPPFLALTNHVVKVRDGLVSLCFGALLSIIALEVLNEPVVKDTAQYYAQQAYVLGKGKNVVNVILVDFRGMDTLVEITVLTIAAIGVYSMLKLIVSPSVKE